MVGQSKENWNWEAGAETQDQQKKRLIYFEFSESKRGSMGKYS